MTILKVVEDGWHGQGDARFYAVLDELRATHDAKQQDYGTGEDPFANINAAQEFAIPPWVHAASLVNHKLRRIKSFVTKGRLANESVEDSLRDAAVYSIIALVLYREANPTESEHA